MKNLSNGALRRNGNSFALINTVPNMVLMLGSIFLVLLLSTSCKKQEVTDAADQLQSINRHAANSNGNVLTNYTGLAPQTIWELQQARAATAKYQNIDNALQDGYADIEVDVQHMGHHFMKMSIVDSVFDIRQPEILVYNKNDKGEQQLVAVEYAVPLSYPMPEGFTGSSDVWNGTSGFPLWLLHAWVWAYNPDGVFNWTNPSVELH